MVNKRCHSGEQNLHGKDQQPLVECELINYRPAKNRQSTCINNIVTINRLLSNETIFIFK